MEPLIDLDRASRWRTLLSNHSARTTNWALAGMLGGIALMVGALLVFLTPVGGIAVLVAGLAALLVLRDIRWGLFALLAVVCLLPFASLPFKIGFTPTFLDLAFGALYAVWGMRLIMRQQDDFVVTPLGLPVLVFIALAAFSFVLGVSYSRPSANDLRTFAELILGFGMFFLAVNCVRKESLLRQITAVLVLAGTVESAVGVFLYAIPSTWAVRFLNPLGRLGYPVGLGALRFINDDPNRPMRAIGTNVDPNILGALLVITLAIAAAQLFAKRPVLPRLWIGLSTGVMGICLFLTYSRASMGGAAIALGAIAVLRYRRLVVVLVLASLLLLLLPQTQAYMSHFVQGIQIEDRSTQMRMGEYRDTFKLIRRYPWLGVGFVGTPDIDLYVAVASLYLAIAAQMGVVGLVVFLVVMALFSLYTFRAWRGLPEGASLEPLLLGYGAAIVGSLSSGVLDHTLLTYPHAVSLLWLVLGLGMATAQMTKHFHGTFTPGKT